MTRLLVGKGKSMQKFFKIVMAGILAGAVMITSAISAGAEEINGMNENLKSTTIYFDDLELILDEETVGACNYEVMPSGNTWYTSIPSQYWGHIVQATGNITCKSTAEPTLISMVRIIMAQ